MKAERQAKIMEIISNRNVETQEQLLQELTAATASELTGILPTESLLELKAATYESYNRSALLFVFVLALFSIIGLVNNLLESYQERREEFALYAISGMGPKALARMKRGEIFTVLLLGGIIGLLTCLLVFPLLQFTLSGTVEFFTNIVRFLEIK